MAEIANFVWPLGEDLTIELIYKEGSTTANATPVNLSSGYAVRLDIVALNRKDRIYTFNSEELADVDAIMAGEQPDSVVEGVLSVGGTTTPNIVITVPRSLTLPGGAIYERYDAETPVSTYNYDLFLRNTVTNKQAKILRGTITIEESYTLWQ